MFHDRLGKESAPLNSEKLQNAVEAKLRSVYDSENNTTHTEVNVMTTGLAIFLSALIGITSAVLGMFLAGGLGLVIGMFVFLVTMCICIMMRITELEEILISVKQAKTSTDEPPEDTSNSAAEDGKNGGDQA